MRRRAATRGRFVKPHRVRRRERFLTEEEFTRLGRVLAEAETDGPAMPSTVAAIRLLMLTGCRRSEIMELQWDDVDLEHRELRLRQTKTGPRTVPLNPAAVQVLAGLRRLPDNPWVLPGRQPGRHISSLNEPWLRLRKRAGLEDVRLHDLRPQLRVRARWRLARSATDDRAALGPRRGADDGALRPPEPRGPECGGGQDRGQHRGRHSSQRTRGGHGAAGLRREAWSPGNWPPQQRAYVRPEPQGQGSLPPASKLPYATAISRSPPNPRDSAHAPSVRTQTGIRPDADRRISSTASAKQVRGRPPPMSFHRLDHGERRHGFIGRLAQIGSLNRGSL